MLKCGNPRRIWSFFVFSAVAQRTTQKEKKRKYEYGANLLIKLKQSNGNELEFFFSSSQFFLQPAACSLHSIPFHHSSAQFNGENQVTRHENKLVRFSLPIFLQHFLYSYKNTSSVKLDNFHRNKINSYTRNKVHFHMCVVVWKVDPVLSFVWKHSCLFYYVMDMCKHKRCRQEIISH